MKKYLIILLVFCDLVTYAQQGQQLFLMHYLGESNFLNPAVQSECNWFIGIPVLSSIHLNYANSAFSYRQLVENTSDSTANLQVDRVVDHLGRRTLLATELQVTLLAVGYTYKDYYFAFSIIEKNDLPLTISKDVFALAWEGNTQFEGETASTRGTSIYATHYREYALGVSKRTAYNTFYGIKGKLLFGKVNASARRANVDLFTDQQTFDLTLGGNAAVNLSGPINIFTDNGYVSGLETEPEELDLNRIMALVFNRRNWGLAFDAGFIKQVNDRVSVSGSVLDLGFIGWRSNLNNLTSEEEFTYQGVLVDSGRIVRSIMDSIDLEITHDRYYTLLPVKLFLGAEYTLSEKLAGRVITSAVVYRTKLAPKLTLGLDYNPFGYFHLVASYSLMYRSFNNFGFGLSLGRGPLQFYAVSDNVAGMIWPLSTRNLNLRFGLNINLGCREKDKIPQSVIKSTGGNCECYRTPWERQKRRK